MIKKSILALTLVLSHAALMAQQSGGIQMADEMRANGKIYVVAAVLLTILAGLIIYLVRLDRKMSRLERQTNSSLK